MNKGKSIFSLNPSFTWLNSTQFFGALNDNLFKLFIIFFLIELKGSESSTSINAIAGAVFVLPFLLFSATAGVIAGRFSKRTVTVRIKILEIGIMCLGAMAFFAKSVPGLYFILFLMATQSAFFGPSKYGLVPELVGREKLSKANGFIQAFTFLAIILGTAIAPIFYKLSGDSYPKASLFCILIAVTGLICSFRIEKTPASGLQSKTTFDFLSPIFRTLSSIRKEPNLLTSVIASAYFLLVGGFIQMNLIPYGIETLGIENQENAAYLFLFAALGIGSGSLLAGSWSGRNVEFGIVPIGAAGLALFPVLLGLLPGKGDFTLAAVLIFFTGISAGLFIVPLQAFIQFKSPRETLGEILAANSFLSFSGVLIASGLLATLRALGLSPSGSFVFLGCLTLFLTLAAFRLLSDFVVRFFCVLIIRFCYRLKVSGIEQLPLEGPALLVCNHPTYIDALLLTATQQRRIRFIMYRNFYENRWMKPIYMLMGVIPISKQDSPKQLVRSLREARAALDEGYLVCVFAEGEVTRSGMLRHFKPGFEHILKGSDYPIIPAYIGGGWGSIFSFSTGAILSRRPEKFPYPVSVLYGKPLQTKATAAEVREAVMELSCDYFNDKHDQPRTLAETFVRTARANWKNPAISDTTGKDLTYGKTLIGAIAIASALEPELKDQEKIGLLLPTTVAGTLVNIALSLLGKVSVNLNYSTSAESARSAIDQCKLQTTITARAFLEKIGDYPMPAKVLYLEDIAAGISKPAKLRALLKARFLPTKCLFPFHPENGNSLATIIFSSGSTAEPKGVMLSHHNILSNIEGINQVFRLQPKDKLCGSLPFFHSFGYTGTIWLPLLTGISVAFHPNPLDTGRISALIREQSCTILFTTPTFLLGFIRRSKPEDFKSLRLIVTGAEKLKQRIADAFEKKFSQRPLEGYGTTELSPVATVNLPDVELAGVHQTCTKPGTIGLPIPGVIARILDIETEQRLPQGEEGLIWIKGPNVMQGYLDQPAKTSEVIKDNWYNTGDIGKIDSEGFITITDRLSRFSKIGGEMIPHIAVEESIHGLLNSEDQVLAITSIPDDKKGEKLIVIYTEQAGSEETLHTLVFKSEMPNLWKPGKSSYVKTEALPIL
ncbi:MAG TPA: MFS transporter [Verrucomicrobiales bacterium]|nr:MFS transporter [Verrucomicrobiales bacterium]